MSRLRRLAAVLSALAVAASLSSCGGSSGSKGGASSGGAAKVTLKVYAAASLTESFGEIKKSYEAAHPNVKVVYTFAGSQDLVDQLSNGASGDVLATADEPRRPRRRASRANRGSSPPTPWSSSRPRATPPE